MTKASLIVECRQLAVAVGSVGGVVPEKLQALLSAHELLSQPRATEDPARRIVDAALDGTLDEKVLAKLIPAAAAAHAANEYQQNLARVYEHTLVAERHRQLEKGGADAILTSMRPVFNRHAKAIAEAKSLIDPESSLEHILASGSPELVTAWQQLSSHLSVIGKIAAIAAAFGCRPVATFPQVREFTAGDTYKLDDRALMCTAGGLVADSALFSGPSGGHRSNPFFRCGGLKLHTIEEAQARHDEWAAGEHDRLYRDRPRGGRIGDDGQVIYDELPPNPYRETADA